MSDKIHRKIKIRRHISRAWLEELEKAYPLPDAPPGLCRDAFLQEFLKSLGSSESTETLSSTEDSDLSDEVKFADITQLTGSFNAEERLMKKMMEIGDLRTSLITNKSEHHRLMGADINKLLKERYGNIASSLGFMAVLFQLQDLKDRFHIIREMWKTKVLTNKSLHLFSWSIKNYFTRFNMPDQSYLDAAEREMGKQMECFKFHMDLKEIERLLDAVLEDVRSKRDLCKSSMLVIKDAEVDIEELLTKSQQEEADEHQKIAMAAIQTPRSADPDRSRTRAVNAKINYMDFVYPIEARYRIKWAQTTMEQSIIYDGLSTKQLNDEVQRLHYEIEEMGRLWDISSVSYDMQIMDFKHRIHHKETAYEASLEQCEAQIQMTRNKLAKAKDDLKHYKEQIPMFHQKIAEVQAIMAKQEAERATLERKSRKTSRLSSIRKSLKKKK